MDLKPVREEIDKIDNVIKNLLVLRMSLIPIVTKIKIENGIALHQPGREKEICDNIEEFARETGINSKLVIEIYKLIMSEAVSMEESQSCCNTKDKEKEIVQVDDKIMQEYDKLNKIIESDIPQAINNITKLSDEKLSNILTGIYERRLRK